MTYEEIEYEVADHVATIALNRPEKMNTGTTRMISELLDALDRVDNDDDVRAVILTGRGKAFCAGADLSGGDKTFDYAAGDSTVEAPVEPEKTSTGRLYRDGAGLITLRLFALHKPVIAAINGAAVGMGVTMTLPCDIRIAAESARFGFVFAKRGIVPEGASMWFLPRLVGVSQAAEWVYSGRVFNAPKWKIFAKIRIPNALPYILSALKITATAAVVGAIVGEFVASQKGLGYVIVTTQSSMNTSVAFAALIWISIVGLLLYGVVVLVAHLWAPWAEGAD